MCRGFILQPTYRVEAGRPVVRLFGTLESGESFLVRETRERPKFWIRATDADAARRNGARVGEADGTHDASGAATLPIQVAIPSDVPPLRDRLEDAGIRTYEADVRFAYRYLIDRALRGSIHIEGAARRAEGVDCVFDDPVVTPADWTPELSVLSLDIETDPTASHLLCVALEGKGASEVLLLSPKGTLCPEGATPFATERELVAALVRRVREIDPDVLTGWNVVDFDLAVLARIAARWRIPLALGRGPEPLTLRPAASGRSGHDARITGRVVLDGIALLRGAFLRFDSYSLDAVSHDVLGERKTVRGPNRAAHILEMFRSDRQRLVEYNLHDARLALAILAKLKLVELAVERSRLTGMPPDRVAASIASFDFLYLAELRRRGIVTPTVDTERRISVPMGGGHVLEPVPGLHRNVLVFDFQSLYPSLIRTFQIDPLGLIASPAKEDDAIVAPNGAAFRRAPGILPGILDELFPRREEAKRAGNVARSQAIKILMNSLYGVLGTTACRFFSPDTSNAITSFGRLILLATKDRIEARGLRVLYGDTDSLFVESRLEDAAAAQALGERLARELDEEIAQEIRRTWRVESRLQLKFDMLYRKLLFPEMRHGGGAARKRYAGLVEEDGRLKVVFTGMEVVRRDWTELAKVVQRELYARFFAEQPIDEYLRTIVAEVRAGAKDDLLVYRKGLRKSLEGYTTSTPPHVAAARKAGGTPARVVEYVMTLEGPEPLTKTTSAIDREHYIQKQVRPVAEPVLSVLGAEFDVVVGDDRQMELF